MTIKLATRKFANKSRHPAEGPSEKTAQNLSDAAASALGQSGHIFTCCPPPFLDADAVGVTTGH